MEVFGRSLVEFFLQVLQYGFVAEIYALRVQTVFAIQIARQRQCRMQVDALFGDGVERALNQVVDADVFVNDLVHERRVRTVFQQTAYQVGKQGFVCADRGIHAYAAA